MILPPYPTEQSLLVALGIGAPSVVLSPMSRRELNRFMKSRAEKRSALSKADYRQRRVIRKAKAADRARSKRAN
jgi:hypothetical protein